MSDFMREYSGTFESTKVSLAVKCTSWTGGGLPVITKKRRGQIWVLKEQAWRKTYTAQTWWNMECPGLRQWSRTASKTWVMNVAAEESTSTRKCPRWPCQLLSQGSRECQCAIIDNFREILTTWFKHKITHLGNQGSMHRDYRFHKPVNVLYKLKKKKHGK